jgi:hypothetical protein
MQCQAIKTSVYSMVLVALLNSNSGWADDWKLEKNKNNVSIYSKQTDSGFKEIRVKTIVEAYPHSLVALLNDVEFSSNWIHNCIEVKILSQTSSTERLINSFFTAPWPLKNRDMVFYSKTTFTHNSVQIEISDRGDTTPLNPKYVRMQNMNGLWQASELENGKSEITYTGSGNPGGNIPVFIGNKELITSLFETFQNLKKVILLDQYQPVKITD